MSTWSIEFKAEGVNGHAWGTALQHEFAAFDACLYLLVHSSGTVYLTITGQGCADVLVLDFGSFWQAATIKRWGSTRITYRGTYGGLFLAFPDGSCLEGFEECCDRVLCVYAGTSPAPTLKELQDLGVLPLPRLVGSFLVKLPDDDESDLTSPTSSDCSVLSDEDSDTDASVYTADVFSEEDLAALSAEIGEMQV